jgi:sphinganine-1-phosphate aldolase
MAPASAELPPLPPAVDSATAYGILQSFGIGGGGLPDRQAPLLALIEALPAELGERLLVELLGRLVEPIG